MGNVALNRRCTIICQSRKNFNQTAFPHILQHQKQQIMFEGYKMYNVLLRLCTFHSNAWVWYGSFVCFVEFTHFSQPKEKNRIFFFYYQMCVDVVWQNILVYSNIAQRSIQILDQYFKIYNIKITNNVEIWECRLKIK